MQTALEAAVSTYVVVSEHGALESPVGCDPTAIAARLNELLGGFSGSDLNSATLQERQAFVLRFFGAENAPFAWFSLNHRGVPEVQEVAAYSRNDIVTYLASQPFRRIDLRLRRVGPMRWVPERGNLALGRGTLILFDVHDKETSERLGYGTGKGEYHCNTSSFMVLSLMVHNEPSPWLVGGAMNAGQEP